MSTLTVKLPQGQLRWWKMRLPSNENGHFLECRTNATDEVLSDATEAVYEIFDGDEGEMRGVVSIFMEQFCGKTDLWVLAYGKPSDSDKWVAFDSVMLYPRGHGPRFE